MVHQSLRDPLGNNLRKHFFSQNIEVVSILWTSMNVDVISLSDSSLQDAKGYLFSSVKFQTICTPQFVPQLKSLRRKIGWRAFLGGLPVYVIKTFMEDCINSKYIARKQSRPMAYGLLITIYY